MKRMEIIDSSFPLRKRKYSVMMGYTRTHTDYDSVRGGESIASDVTEKPGAIDLAMAYTHARV